MVSTRPSSRPASSRASRRAVASGVFAAVAPPRHRFQTPRARVEPRPRTCPELLDQQHLVALRVVGQHDDGVAAGEDRAAQNLGHRPVEAPMAQPMLLDREVGRVGLHASRPARHRRPTCADPTATARRTGGTAAAPERPDADARQQCRHLGRRSAPEVAHHLRERLAEARQPLWRRRLRVHARGYVRGEAVGPRLRPPGPGPNRDRLRHGAERRHGKIEPRPFIRAEPQQRARHIGSGRRDQCHAQAMLVAGERMTLDLSWRCRGNPVDDAGQHIRPVERRMHESVTQCAALLGGSAIRRDVT